MEKIHFFDYEELIYGLDCKVISLEGSAATLLSCVLETDGQSEAHNHYERELFLFISGHGRVRSGKSTVGVAAGDAIGFDAFENHIIENIGTDAPLRFLSVYWPVEENGHDAIGVAEGVDRAALVFSTPPTPNGDLHLGHISGPYLAADILKRALRTRGGTAVHVSGRDDHQTYVAVKAAREAAPSAAVADRYARMIQDTWRRAGIVMDDVITPSTNGGYAEFVRQGIRRLRDQGYIIEKEESAAIDPDGRYLHEAYVRGQCPYCSEASDGNACEACGRPNACVDLHAPVATMTGEATTVAPVRRLYFRLSAFSGYLAQYLRMADLPAKVACLGLDMIHEGLPDICVSHPGDWGIAHDIPGFEDQRIYVWFEMAFGYLWGGGRAIFGDGPEPWARATSAYDGSRDVIHAYGFDNAYYHALLFPAIYEGLALDLKPPAVHIVNELLDLEGEKFSTSRGHLIWGRDLLDELPADYVRFILARYRPEGIRADFSLPESLAALNEVFASELAAWINGFLAMATDGTVPEPGAWLADQKAFHATLERHTEMLQSALALSTFSPRTASRTLAALITDGARFVRAQRSLMTREAVGAGNYCRTTVALSAVGLALIVRFGAPLIPGIAEQLNALLGSPDLNVRGATDFFPAGYALEPTAVVELPRVDVGLGLETPGAGRNSAEFTSNPEL